MTTIELLTAAIRTARETGTDLCVPAAMVEELEAWLVVRNDLELLVLMHELKLSNSLLGENVTGVTLAASLIGTLDTANSVSHATYGRVLDLVHRAGGLKNLHTRHAS